MKYIINITDRNDGTIIDTLLVESDADFNTVVKAFEIAKAKVSKANPHWDYEEIYAELFDSYPSWKSLGATVLEIDI